MGLVNVLSNLGTGIATMFTSVLQVLSQIFFTIDATSGDIAVTPLGYLSLIGLVIGIVYRLFTWVRGLISRGSSR